jgi:hypothetical protein
MIYCFLKKYIINNLFVIIKLWNIILIVNYKIKEQWAHNIPTKKKCFMFTRITFHKNHLFTHYTIFPSEYLSLLYVCIVYIYILCIFLCTHYLFYILSVNNRNLFLLVLLLLYSTGNHFILGRRHLIFNLPLLRLIDYDWSETNK